MVRTARAAGYEVTVYARLEPGLPVVERTPEFTIIRAPIDWRQLVPGLRGPRLARYVATHRTALARSAADPNDVVTAPPLRARGRSLGARLRRLPKTSIYFATLPLRPVLGPAVLFPLRPLAWAAALALVAEPAEIWHGMWAGSLPALVRLRAKFGGRTIYDSRDVYMHARGIGTLPAPIRAGFRWFERRWARKADAVITVNQAYGEIIERTLGVKISAVVMNCPFRYDVPNPRPNLIRDALGLPASTRIVLYQGLFLTDRGIEQGMDAIVQVPDAVLVLLGFGSLQERLSVAAARPPYAGKVFLIPAVPPEDLVTWTASADVMLMAIQPSTLNHQYTTPQKLWEALAAGVPIVASDLPGMAPVIRDTRAGMLCDPRDPVSIAGAIGTLLGLSEAAFGRYGAAALAAAHDRYNWEVQAEALLDVYARLVPA